MTPARAPVETAADLLKRLLALIPRLADGQAHPIADIAAEAGVSPGTLVKDLNSLVDRYDTPGGWIDPVSIEIDATHVTVRSDHFLRPMRLTMGELCALELGLRLLRAERPVEQHQAIDDALARLRQAIMQVPRNDPSPVPRVATPGPLAEAEARHLATVRGALGARRKLVLAYRAGAADAATTRTVAPYGLLHASSAWYLVAHCDRAGALRFFRIDRVESVALDAATFEPPADFALDRVAPGGRAFAAASPGAVTVRYGPAIARWVAEREGREPDADGALEVTHPLADVDWAVRHVLQYGPDAEVLDPPQVRDAVAARLREALAAVG